MPVNEDGSLRAFTADEIAAMEIETFDVRQGAHPVESRRRDENVMTRPFFVKWSERFNFLELAIGRSKTWDDSGTTKLSRLLPDSTYGRHPESTSIIATKATDIRGHTCGRDNVGHFPEYPKAVVTLEYEEFPALIHSDAGLVSERERFTSLGESSSEVEAYTMPGGAFVYVESGGGGISGTPCPFNISWTRPVRRFVTWWHDLPIDLYTPNGALFERLYVGDGDTIPFLGCVNSDTLTLTSLGTYSPGQLLLEGVEDRFFRSPLSAAGFNLKVDVGLKWAYTPRGWLSLPFWDPATPANSKYAIVTNDGNYYTAATMPDQTGLYNCRPMSDLWDPDI
jgi:hypothetical protein